MAPPRSPVRTRKITSKECTCSKCGLTTHSIPGTKHRRCTGHENATSTRPKHSAAPAGRGTWV